MTTAATLSISELSRQSGVSQHTLRYYEKAEVLAAATRATNGHRRYLASDVEWLAFVLRLKAMGMPLAEIKRYAALRLQGEMTVPQRLAVLELHRSRLVVSIQELSNNLATLDDKIGLYRRSMQSLRKATPTTRKQ